MSSRWPRKTSQPRSAAAMSELARASGLPGSAGPATTKRTDWGTVGAAVLSGLPPAVGQGEAPAAGPGGVPEAGLAAARLGGVPEAGVAAARLAAARLAAAA